MRDADFRERVELVLDRVTPSTWIGRVVELKRAGREFIGLCPFHTEKSGSFTVNDRKRFFHCFGCGEHGDVIKFVRLWSRVGFLDALELLEAQHGLDRFVSAPAPVRAAMTEEARRRQAARDAESRQERERKQRTMHGLWEARRPVEAGGPVDAYLQGRAIEPPARYGVGDPDRNAGWPEDIAYAPACWHSDAKDRYPAMIAAIRGPTGDLWAVHLTFLVLADRGHWTKRSFTERNWAKRVLGSYVHEAGEDRRIGGCIALGPHAPAMVGGEGIETSLSAMQIWRRSGLCFVTSGNMPNVELPFPCTHFIYAADRDPKRVGERMAWRAARAHGRARTVEVVVPRMSDPKCDFNDFVRRRAAREGRAA